MSIDIANIANPKVAPYYLDRRAALSLTFDDGFTQEVEDASEIIEPLGLRGTFFLIPLDMGDEEGAHRITWSRARRLLEAGHELGTHDLIKFKQHELPADELGHRINESWQLIKEKTGQTPITYAMPGGSKITDLVLETIYQKHYLLRGHGEIPMVTAGYGNTDFRQWSDAQTRERIEASIANREWFIPVIHSIFGGYSPFASKDEFRVHCEWIAAQQDKLWVAPMGEVGRYALQRKASSLEVVTRNDDSMTFALSHTLPDKVSINQTMTIVLSGANTGRAEVQGGRAELVARGDDLLINCRPDGQPVTVRWQ